MAALERSQAPPPTVEDRAFGHRASLRCTYASEPTVEGVAAVAPRSYGGNIRGIPLVPTPDFLVPRERAAIHTFNLCFTRSVSFSSAWSRPPWH